MSSPSVREATLTFLPLFPGFLSLVGSLLLIKMLLQEQCRLPYRRILFVLSCFDLLQTLSIGLGPFLFARGSFAWGVGPRSWAVGTERTCHMIGFINQLSFTSGFGYYGVSSLYYLLRVRYNVSDLWFGRYLEPWIHLFIIGSSLTLAVVFSALPLLGDPGFGFGCWIAPNPSIGCGLHCVKVIRWAVSGAWLFLVMAFVIVSNLLLYDHVRRTHQRSQRSSLRGPQASNAQIRAVAQQAFLYVTVFFLTYIWTFFFLVFTASDVATRIDMFPFSVLSSIFLPSMGFGNFIVYITPRYRIARHNFPQKSRWFALQTVIHSGPSEQESPLSSSRSRSKSKDPEEVLNDVNNSSGETARVTMGGDVSKSVALHDFPREEEKAAP